MIEQEKALIGLEIDGEMVQFVDKRTYDRVVSHFQNRCLELVAFGRAQGLTDEMFDEWKAAQ